MGRRSIGWGECFARLIRHGHARAELTGYTRRQIELFHCEAEQAERDARADQIINITAALSKDGLALIKELRRKSG